MITKGHNQAEIAAWAAFANGGAAVADAEIQNRLKAQMIENRMALVDISDGRPSDATNSIPGSQALLRPHSKSPVLGVPSVLDPAAASTSMGPRASLEDSMDDIGKVQEAPQTAFCATTPVVCKAWREVVSASPLDPVEPLNATANGAKGVPRPYSPEPSLLD
jgi:hypothetical protein